MTLIRYIPILLCLMVASVLAQPIEPSAPFSVLVAKWTRILDEAEHLSQTTGVNFEQIERFRLLLSNVYEEASAARQAAARQIGTTELLLEALGKPPDADQPPEPDKITTQRQQYNQDFADYRARVSMADLTMARATAIDTDLRLLGRGWLRAYLKDRDPSPLDTGTLERGLQELRDYLLRIIQTPLNQIQVLSPSDQLLALTYSGLAIFFSAMIGWFLRCFLLRNFGQERENIDPSYRHRLGAAIAEGIANGVIPSLMIGALLSLTYFPEDLLTPQATHFYSILGAVLIFFILCTALVYAVLTPALPQWRLFPLSSRSANAMSRRIVMLAGLFALDVFLRNALIEKPRTSSELSAVYSLLVHSGEAILLFSLTRSWLWQPENIGEGDQSSGSAFRLFMIARWLTAGLIILAVIGLLNGYNNFGRTLTHALLITGLVSGFLFLFRGLLNELLHLALSQLWHNEVQTGRMHIIMFWFDFLLTAALWVAGIILILPYWGVSSSDFWALSHKLLDGVDIGNVTLSPSDVGAAILVFSIVLVINRLIQRFLRERILPQTQLSQGVQYSIVAGAGYFGVFLAILLGAASFGINLENIALVAGALSVGIGFGIRNIVNNLISGMILLAERPVKVGDWVVIGDNEGIVRHINMRAIELESFQRSSILVPNADMIANPVINMTHRGTIGRIEIAVGVAYGSDPIKVRDLLLECARRNLKTLYDPEPFVLFQKFGSSRLEFELRCFTGDVMNRLSIASELRYAIGERFHEEKIVIPLPQQVVHLANPTTASPKEVNVKLDASDTTPI